MPFRQIPQRLGLLERGTLGSSVGVRRVVVKLVLAVIDLALEVLELVVTVVVAVFDLMVVEDSGTLGLGQVTSLDSSGQNSRIFWYRYHWRVGESPVGVRRSGRTLADGVQSSLRRLKSTSGPSDVTRAKTCPGALDEKRRWWNDLSPANFFVCSYRKLCQSCVGTVTVPSGVPVS